MAKPNHKLSMRKDAVDGTGVSGVQPTSPMMANLDYPKCVGGTYKTYPGATGVKTQLPASAYTPGTLLETRKVDGHFRTDRGSVSSDNGGACGTKSPQDYGK